MATAAKQSRCDENATSSCKVAVNGDHDTVATATSAVLVRSEPITDAPVIVGYDFNEGVNFDKLLASYATTGFQVSRLSLASKYNRNECINSGLTCRQPTLAAQCRLCNKCSMQRLRHSNCLTAQAQRSIIQKGGKRPAARYFLASLPI